jgi:hypothetical protein
MQNNKNLGLEIRLVNMLSVKEFEVRNAASVVPKQATNK